MLSSEAENPRGGTMSKCSYCRVNDTDVFGEYCSFECMIMSQLEDSEQEGDEGN